MDTHRFDQLLLETLEDGRLSRGEKRALTEVIAAADLSHDQIAQLRSRVFAVARDHGADVDYAQLLRWVDGVLKALRTRPPVESHTARVLFSPDDDCVSALRELFGGARQAADVCVFTITDDRVSDAILRAHKRGLRVRVISDDDKSHDLGSDIDRLARAGVPVRVDRSPHHMHHKYAVFDGHIAATGSYNWTRSAAEHNAENLVISDDPRLVDAYGRAFDRMWSQLA
jgi:phosphatidylserine/phosphatidylglycerophosphate/cardiolipin synthase-like enzyme